MASIAEYIKDISSLDKNFIGTIALRHEELSLPDGSKIALGIDDGFWVLVYQELGGRPFKVYECDWREKKINVDKKQGGEEDLKEFKKLLNYFLSQAKVADLVTIQPPQI